MKLNVFSTYDSKAKAWTLPFFMAESDSILRAWTEVVNDPSTRFGQYPADYTMFQLGTFQVTTGKFDVFAAPESIGVGSHFLRQPVVDVFGNSANSILNTDSSDKAAVGVARRNRRQYVRRKSSKKS